MVRVTFVCGRGRSSHREFKKGTLLHRIAKEIPGPSAIPILAARVGNRLLSLADTVESDATVEWIGYDHPMGQEIYQRTASFILFMAVAELYQNSRLILGHSLGNGLYYDFYSHIPVNPEILNAIREKMHLIIESDLPFRRSFISRPEAIRFFGDRAINDTLRLIENSPIDGVQVYENGRFATFELYPLAYSTGAISQFELKTYAPGLVMLFPQPADFRMQAEIGKNRKLFAIYQESKSWGKILSVNDVGRLNQVINQQGISELIKIAESLHEKKIADIADTITARREDLHLVLVAGPSASGKTTFSKRLAIHLRVNGIRPLALSLDNYFIDRDRCPRDENNVYDFESLAVVDLKLFNDQLSRLLNGYEVEVPKFDFESGRRIEDHFRLRLEEDQLLIIEGIHCLNEQLTSGIADKNKFRIYISPLTQLAIDDHHRIATTDTRILRRLVRDHRFRNYSAAATLTRFPSVIRGERRNIFPFQENADVMFNSALVYELAALKDYAIPLLQSIAAADPTFLEAQRLLTFLQLFQSVPAAEIPPTSILREFIGGSSFKY